jgi:hypothetical protein
MAPSYWLARALGMTGGALAANISEPLRNYSIAGDCVVFGGGG